MRYGMFVHAPDSLSCATMVAAGRNPPFTLSVSGHLHLTFMR